jgi:hypothetical protein
LTLLLLLPLVLSEVLANEPGSVVSLEWIELYAEHDLSLQDFTLTVKGDSVALPDLRVDSGAYAVLCRDTVRFEEHYGDSSGVWGDDSTENYALSQIILSLPNSSGSVELSGPGGADSFGWDGSAGDGTSYERIDDTSWGVTASEVRSTPGRRNHGAPVRFDWGVVQVEVEPQLPEPYQTVTIRARVENRGTEVSSTQVSLEEETGMIIDSLAIGGEPGLSIEAAFRVVAKPGLNVYEVAAAADERSANNRRQLLFMASLPPVWLSEIYAVPEGSEPEWLELFCASDTALASLDLQIADTRDTVSLFDLEVNPGDYVVVTYDSAAFRNRYFESVAPVWQVPDLPALNNDGDTIALLLSGALVEKVGYPSVSSRRGVSLERVGASSVWGFSVASGGATPGMRNSIDVDYTATVGLDVSPNPFAAGLGERATIAYTVPFGAEAELRLYGGDGRHLHTLIQREPVVSGEITWDGRDDSGRLLPVGIYLLQFKLHEPHEASRLTTVVIAR